jgi:hypothetical protein
MNNLYPWDTAPDGGSMSEQYPWDITPDMSAKEKCDAYAEFMEKRYGRIFEYIVQYKWPEKCRPTINPDHVFTTIGFYKSIGEFLMWNPGLINYSMFELVMNTEKERPREMDLYKKETYYQAIENGYKVEFEELLRWHLMAITMNS